MGVLDDILADHTTVRKPFKVGPPPVDGTLTGLTGSSGQSVMGGVSTDINQKEAQAPKNTVMKDTSIGGTDASSLVGSPGKETGLTLPQDKRLSYVDMFNILNPEKPETEEEKKTREKKEKREALLSAIGDGISAMSNLFFTTQYAPNSYNPKEGMSAKARERWDRLRAEREANRRIYNEGYIRARQMDDANEKEERNWRHAIGREKIADQRYDAKAAQDKALADLNEKLKGHQITEAEYKSEQARIATQFAEESEKLKQENLRAGITQKIST